MQRGSEDSSGNCAEDNSLDLFATIPGLRGPTTELEPLPFLALTDFDPGPVALDSTALVAAPGSGRASPAVDPAEETRRQRQVRLASSSPRRKRRNRFSFLFNFFFFLFRPAGRAAGDVLA